MYLRPGQDSSCVQVVCVIYQFKLTLNCCSGCSGLQLQTGQVCFTCQVAGVKRQTLETHRHTHTPQQAKLVDNHRRHTYSDVHMFNSRNWLKFLALQGKEREFDGIARKGQIVCKHCDWDWTGELHFSSRGRTKCLPAYAKPHLLASITVCILYPYSLDRGYINFG